MSNPEASNHCPTIYDEIQTEVDYQRRCGWKDENNTCGLWIAYIVNYATRWAMPTCFNPDKYTFRTCMVKTAALCVSAIRWWETQSGDVDYDATDKV
jgi:hypothetical protein